MTALPSREPERRAQSDRELERRPASCVNCGWQKLGRCTSLYLRGRGERMLDINPNYDQVVVSADIRGHFCNGWSRRGPA